MFNIDTCQFRQITVEDCINYTLYQGIEEKVNYAVNSYFNNHKVTLEDLENAELYKFLERILLKIGNSPEIVADSKKYNLDQRYLYIVIKKHVLLRLKK